MGGEWRWTMMARFRIRAAGGREFTLGTLDAFVQRVQTGDIAPSDLVFDGLTGEWAPARSHPAYHLSADPLVREGGGEAESSDGLEGWSDLGASTMDLVDVEEASPEDEAQAFIARMEAERRFERDTRPARVSGESLLDPQLGLVSGVVPQRDPWLERRVKPPRATVAMSGSSGDSGRSRSRWRWWVGFSVLLCAGLAATATVAWPALRTSGTLTRRADEVSARDARPVLATESAVRGAARSDFLRAVEDLRRDQGVGRVPRAWLEGRYLADPKAYPEVRDYWDRYVSFVEAVHQREAALYRDAYLNAEERAGIAGPMRSLRMAGAAGDFEAQRPERDAFYAQVWKLAAAAVSLHETLLSLEGRVSYEPLRGPRVSADPVIEAVGTDPEAQGRLEAALDRVLTALAPLQNGELTTEGARQRVPTWMVNGLTELTAR